MKFLLRGPNPEHFSLTDEVTTLKHNVLIILVAKCLAVMFLFESKKPSSCSCCNKY